MPASKTTKRTRELWAGLLALAISAPMVFMLARALADGFARQRTAPLTSLFGSETYAKLRDDDESERHYIGNEYRAPDFALSDRYGKPWELSEHRGKVIVLNFWSVTCRPCIREMPTLEELAKMAERWDDVEVVAVSTDDGWNQVRTVLPEDPALEVLFDPDENVVEGKFGTRLYPETWIIDKRGVIRFRYDGALDWSSPLAIDIVDLYR